MRDNCGKIKVLFIYPSLSTGGAEELHFLTLKNLWESGRYALKVCCIEHIGKIGEKIKSLGIEVDCLGISARPTNIFTTLSLTGYLLKNKFDIVQTSLFNANFHGRIAAILTRVPIIISEEHSEHYQYGKFKFIPYIWADKVLSGFTNKIICCSRNLMHSISQLENIPLNKFLPLLNTFNVEKLKVSRNPLELKKELDLSATDLVISNVASLCHRKGQDLLIKAFKAVSDRFPCAKLLIMGNEDKGFKRELCGLVRNLRLSEKVLFLGEKNNIADYLNITEIFALSSRFEGIPLALLEAMYMELPVIAPEVGGVSEVITDDRNGILIKPNEPESLTRALIGLLGDKEKRTRIAQEARKTVLERFSAERYLNQLEGLYSELFEANFLERANAYKKQ